MSPRSKSLKVLFFLFCFVFFGVFFSASERAEIDCDIMINRNACNCKLFWKFILFTLLGWQEMKRVYLLFWLFMLLIASQFRVKKWVFYRLVLAKFMRHLSNTALG